MVETITPVVHGGRRSRYWIAIALHALGAGVAAALLGALLGAAGALLGAPWDPAGALAIAAVAVAYAARELLGLPHAQPERRRQVPDWWRTFFSPRVAAFLYGLGLGPGFLTFLGYGTFVAVAMAALVGGDPVLGAALCAPFGLARGLAAAVGGLTGPGDGEGSVTDRLDELAATGLVRRLNGVTLAALAALALAVAA
jgi:hypothetical protein